MVRRDRVVVFAAPMPFPAPLAATEHSKSWTGSWEFLHRDNPSDVDEPFTSRIINGTMMPRSLNNALQARLKDWRISLSDVPALPRLVEDYLAGVQSKALFVAGLRQAFRRQTAKIPRRGARGGHEQVPTPDIQMKWLIEDVLTIVESAKSAPLS